MHRTWCAAPGGSTWRWRYCASGFRHCAGRFVQTRLPDTLERSVKHKTLLCRKARIRRPGTGIPRSRRGHGARVRAVGAAYAEDAPQHGIHRWASRLSLLRGPRPSPPGHLRILASAQSCLLATPLPSRPTLPQGSCVIARLSPGPCEPAAMLRPLPPVTWQCPPHRSADAANVVRQPGRIDRRP